MTIVFVNNNNKRNNKKTGIDVIRCIYKKGFFRRELC